ncbi:MAG: PQQ-binding-like beta-propeller repeat protein [Halioglobus sp.]
MQIAFASIAAMRALCLYLMMIVSAGLPLVASAGVDCVSGEVAGIDPTVRLNGWGFNEKNHRFIPQSRAGITPDNVESLQLKWAFALPGAESPRALPLITSNTIVVADEDGGVYALDRDSGCQRWHYDADEMVRTALRYIRHGEKHLVAFGTWAGELITLNLITGDENWRVNVSDHPYGMLSGSPIDHDGVIYQPVSSYELAVAINPFYACCTFRSSIVAVSVDTGDIQWRAHTIEEQPGVVEPRRFLPDRKGPSGAPVWSQPTLDLKRQRLYVGTGENYSAPATDTSDAILAFDMKTGKRLWKRQFLGGDVWNLACVTRYHPNCPEEQGEDLDFGAPPILVTVAGRDYLLAGQKRGRFLALDPAAEGAPVWSDRTGSGGKAGGVHFAMAVDEKRGVLYVPISDRPIGDLVGDSFNGTPNPSLHAYDIATGRKQWEVSAPGDCRDASGDAVKGCFPGFSAAITATDNLVFAPTLDGYLRAFDADTGTQRWSFDSTGRHSAVNGGMATGGAIDAGGILLDDGQLFVVSGYGQFSQIPGNAFLVFEVPRKAEGQLSE